MCSNSIHCPFDLDDYTDEQVVVITVNAKTKNLLYNAISGEEYEEISRCETSKEMWDKFEATYEWTNKLKETRINLLVGEYELFQMKDGESAEEMFSRFSKILGAKGHRSECQNLDKISYDELIGDLIAFEKTHLDRQIQQKKGKTVAFKATVAEPEAEEEGGEHDENIAMLSQVVTSMMKKNRNSIRGKPNFRKGRINNKNDGRCYECRKHKHIQADCLELKKNLSRNLQRKKSFGACSDEEESDHEEIANMCFMAIEDDSNEELGELGFSGNRGENEEEDSDQLGLMEDEETSETITKLDGGTVTFGDKSKENVIGVGKVPLSSTCDVDEVYLVDELGYNLLNFSQLCDDDYEFSIRRFNEKKVTTSLLSEVDHGREFESKAFENFCNDQGISHNFSSPRSPQQNRVVEHKNRTLQDMERTMIVENSLPHHFWEEASINVERDPPSNNLNEWKSEPGYPYKLIIRDPQEGITTRRSQKNKYHVALITQLEPKKLDEALKDTRWISSMKEEIDQFEKNKVRELVQRPSNFSIIGTKWVFRKKLNESGQVQEGIDYDETFALVARLESIRILLVFAAHKGFKLFQMDVKSAFLNVFISEEVYMKQPPGFANVTFPDHAYKLTKALYGHKQAPRSWY
ncbi:uncharacterized protein [Nicotiana sylvestris]|uniref:uncharacterized protein n=1 Tax=Nicotiana sylvestris TaxID=4096 RepID=UPI00388CA8BD